MVVTGLSCAGMDKVQVSTILAQIDFMLTDKQHDALRYTKILSPEKEIKFVCV